MRGVAVLVQGAEEGYGWGMQRPDTGMTGAGGTAACHRCVMGRGSYTVYGSTCTHGGAVVR